MRRLTRLVVVVAAAAAFASCGGGGDVVTISHPEVAGATLVPAGTDGASPGDVRVFSFPGTDDAGVEVQTDWIMTTTAVAANGDEIRMVVATITWPGTGDQLVLEGTADYPASGATLDRDTVVNRAITGGTGQFAGASGRVETTHFVDGHWEHAFYLD